MERELQPNIKSFIKIRENCIFCQTPMSAILTNFIGIRNNGLPLLRVPINNDKIIFNIDKVTRSNTVKAKGEIDITSNEMIIDPFSRNKISEKDPQYHLFKYTEEYLAQYTFEEQAPHITIYCPSKKCKFQYNLDSDVIKCARDPKKENWYIKPFLLFQETFILNNLWIQNDWIHSQTNIFSISISNSEPIKNPLLDFKSIDKDKLINRIKMLVIFS